MGAHVTFDTDTGEVFFTDPRLATAMEALAKVGGRMASRPVVGTIRLANPACERKCATCYLECAIVPQRLAWWEGEVARLMGATYSPDQGAC